MELHDLLVYSEQYVMYNKKADVNLTHTNTHSHQFICKYVCYACYADNIEALARRYCSAPAFTRLR